METRLFYIFILLLCLSCSQPKQKGMTPWGTSLDADSVPADTSFGVSDIQTNGEMIMLTLTGPDNYYDYHGRGMGLQYMLCERFAQKLGVSLRVEVCKDTAELVSRLRQGDGDVAAFQLPKTVKNVIYAGASDTGRHTQWAVRQGNRELADSLNAWFRPQMVAQVRQEENFLLSTRSITRHVYSPMLDRSGGVISHYDHLFRQYAPLARWDWRLLAAQCYQESTFDPKAHSWAGACGLMQIMPSTAEHLGLPQSGIYDPENNIAAAAKYIRELSSHFSDVPASERVYFVLASYNGGSLHIRDAMALARKHGGDSRRWSDVREYVLRLSQPAYYNDPVVQHGYMRGGETVDYVEKIRGRWAQYRGVAAGGGMPGSGFVTQPERAKRKYRWHL